MDRRNYDAKALGVFDIIGSYFVDVFYNHHYLLARDAVKGGRVSNVTDGYRSNVLNYMNGIAHRENLFKKVVYQLHEFYQKNSGFGSIVLSEFQDRVLAQFIPPEYYRDFADRHKDRTLREIIIRTVNEFGEIAVGRDVLPRIIDDHMNRENVNILQDRIVDIFILQREDYYSKFAREISKQNAGNTIDKETVRKLKEAYVAEKKKSCDLVVDRERALNMIQQLMIKIKQLESENSQLTARIAYTEKSRSNEQPQIPATEHTDVIATSTTSTRRRSRANGKKTPYPSPTASIRSTREDRSPREDRSLPTTANRADKSPREDASDSEEEITDEELHRRQREKIANLQSRRGNANQPDTVGACDNTKNASSKSDPLDDPAIKLDMNIASLLDDDPWNQ